MRRSTATSMSAPARTHAMRQRQLRPRGDVTAGSSRKSSTSTAATGVQADGATGSCSFERDADPPPECDSPNPSFSDAPTAVVPNVVIVVSDMGQSADEPPTLTPLAATTLTPRFAGTTSAASLRPRNDVGDSSPLPASPSAEAAVAEAAPMSSNFRRRSYRRRLLLAPFLSRCHWPTGRSAAVLVMSAFNVLFAVSLVITCKLSYDRARLPNLTLTAIHLATSLVALRLSSAFNVVCSGPRIPAEGGGTAGSEALLHLEHWKVAVALCAFMALPNLSLEYNTAGTSLLIRLLALPITAALQSMLFGRRHGKAVVISLLPVAVGVGLNAFGDLSFNVAGLIFGVAGAVAAAWYLTLAAEQQQRVRQSPGQLLEGQLRFALPVLAMLALVLEPPWLGPRGLLARRWPARDAALLVGSSLVGCLLTLSMQWLLGRTSALTYQVLGHVKMCVTLVACAVVFEEHLKPLQQVGVFLTMFGAMLYTAFKVREQKSTAPSGTRNSQPSTAND